MTSVLMSLRHIARKSPQSKASSISFFELRRRHSTTPPNESPKDAEGGGISAAPGGGYGVRLWGLGGSGQLGFPVEQTSKIMSSESQAKPKATAGYEKSGIRAVACGMDHTALVTWDGKLLTCGSDKNSKLGLGDTNRGSDTLNQKGKQQVTPAQVEGLDGVKVAIAACGEHHTIAVDDQGVAYSWGWGGSAWSGGGALGLGSMAEVPIPTVITALSDEGAKVAKVSAGQNHTVFLTTDGEVWTCGAGEYGRLGRASGMDQLVPVPIEDLEDYVIVDVKAGQAFSLALTSEGEVLGWGRNDAGQLGLGGTFTMDVYSMEDMPRRVELLAGEKVTAIAAGHGHAACVTADGKLFMWGMKRSLEPEHMVTLDGVRVVDVSCGEKYTAAITDTGDLYTFGKGGHYLGHGDKSAQPQPKRVESLSRVRHVSCGHKHMAALLEAP